MGICSSSSRSSDSDNNGRSEREGLPQGDLPLSTDKPSWTTREPKTREEILRQQREVVLDHAYMLFIQACVALSPSSLSCYCLTMPGSHELSFQQFWDTTPMLEGRQEIWNALRAAANSDDHDFAQTILASAGVRLPDGTLRVAYDELGNIYRLPMYCICMPDNVLGLSVACADQPMDNPSEAPSSPTTTPAHPAAGQASASGGIPARQGDVQPLKIRVSNGRNLTLEDAGQDDTIRRIRALVAKEVNLDPNRLLMMFVGKALADKVTLSTLGIRKNEVLQVMLLP
eukprot:TRINITY_DN9448_c0_g1_i5.p1 TRINITY_DN9448_c0_g1~~TRINITY_DN9448_c0_g1_i5.p1  ORF type:complete len:286 (+),score=60.78 TRINITY_DN9448_c0_g1_i5:1167-2024(+)